MRCLRPRELNHFLKVRQLKREKFEFRHLLLSGSNMPGNWIYYPILPIILLMWGSVRAGIETLNDRKMKQGHFVLAGGGGTSKVFKKMWLCGEVLFKECEGLMETRSDWDHVSKANSLFPVWMRHSPVYGGTIYKPLSVAFLCLRFFLSWEFTRDKLGNSLRRWVFLRPSDALRAAERIQRFTNELSLYSTVCFEIFSLNLFHK